MYGNPVDPAKTTWSTSKKMAAADAAYFQTLDGFSVALYYNPHCASSEQNDLVARDYGGSDASYKGITIAGQWAVDTVCFNAVYDMNGPKGPNQVGKDVGFVGGFYEGAAARSAAVLPMDNDSSAKQMTGNNSAVAFCEKMGKDVSLPTIDELTLIYLNNTLAGEPSAPFCSRSAVPGMASAFRYVNFSYGSRDWTYSSTSTRVRCVRTDG